MPGTNPRHGSNTGPALRGLSLESPQGRMDGCSREYRTGRKKNVWRSQPPSQIKEAWPGDRPTDRSQVWPPGESSALGEGEHAGKGGERKDVAGG